MGDTTITIDSSVKERLNNYRHSNHNSWTDVLNGMMNMLPELSDVQDGCVHCGEPPRADIPTERLGGVTHWFSHNDFHGQNYFCSPECAIESEEEYRKYVPENPDLVIVGGVTTFESQFEGASFYRGEGDVEVGIPVPGAFSGTDSDGNEYQYVGEPVYVKNDEEWIYSGVIDSIIHEESHTGLILGDDYAFVMKNHPDEQKQEEYREIHQRNEQMDCHECGCEILYKVMDPPEICPDCEHELE